MEGRGKHFLEYGLATILLALLASVLLMHAGSQAPMASNAGNTPAAAASGSK